MTSDYMQKVKEDGAIEMRVEDVMVDNYHNTISRDDWDILVGSVCDEVLQIIREIRETARD